MKLTCKRQLVQIIAKPLGGSTPHLEDLKAAMFAQPRGNGSRLGTKKCNPRDSLRPGPSPWGLLQGMGKESNWEWTGILMARLFVAENCWRKDMIIRDRKYRENRSFLWIDSAFLVDKKFAHSILHWTQDLP